MLIGCGMSPQVPWFEDQYIRRLSLAEAEQDLTCRGVANTFDWRQVARCQGDLLFAHKFSQREELEAILFDFA